MKKGSISTVLLILVFLAGLSLLLYPTVSNYWNSFHASYTISKYDQQINEMDRHQYEKALENAHAYNAGLQKDSYRLEMDEEQKKEYESLLNVLDNGIMGYIEIPKINVSLPIYHGTEDTVLQIAVGHIEGSSLPVGGIGTHAVLSGHRGLPSAKLFSDLDKMAEGDTFLIHVLDETLTYQVDQIRIVLPEETDDLEIDEKKDLCTLVTCTPYGINTHRLLVRGTRIENQQGVSRGHVQANAVRIEPLWIAPVVAAVLLLLLVVIMLMGDRRRRR